MAVTNGWGQGVINNTNGWGKLATNNIGAGSVYENSASGDTVLVASSSPPFNTKSILFDGVDDFVTVADDASLKVVTANHSLSFWMKTTDGSTQVLSEKGSGDELAAWIVSNKIRWAGANSFDSSTSVNDGNWKHIVFVADGSSSFIYVNGSLDATGSTKIQASANSSNYVFGARSGGSFAFDGQLDQIAIFNRALSSTEVSALYNSGTVTTLPSGAVAHYKLGEEANFTNNWLINNSTLSNYSTRSFDFDGVDDFIDCGNNDNLSFGDGSTDSAFSISSWLNMDNVVRFRIISKYDTSKEEYFFSTSSGRQLVLNLYSQNNSAVKIGRIGSTILTPYIGTWIHVCATYDGSGSSSGIKIYINGVRDDANNNNAGSYVAMQNNTAPVRIGSGASYFANGSIDETAIFNTELSASDVTSIYNSGTPSDISSLSPISHWRMGENATFSTNWSLPDNGSASNTGTSSNMDLSDLVGDAPNYTGAGLSNNMTIEDRVGNAPNSDNNAVSFNMTESDRETDVPS